MSTAAFIYDYICSIQSIYNQACHIGSPNIQLCAISSPYSAHHSFCYFHYGITLPYKGYFLLVFHIYCFIGIQSLSVHHISKIRAKKYT